MFVCVCVCVCKDEFREKDYISRMFVCVCKDGFRENKINFAKKTIFCECLCVCKNGFRENKINFREKVDISRMFVCV